MALEWSEESIEDNYIKYICVKCWKEFIVGEENSKGHNLKCPYCTNEDVEWYSKIDEEKLEDIGGLGCCGIYIETDS